MSARGCDVSDWFGGLDVDMCERNHLIEVWAVCWAHADACLPVPTDDIDGLVNYEVSL